MSVSVSDYRPEEQYVDRNNRVMHPYAIRKAGKTIVNLDAANRSLGSASCGPDVMEKYELRSEDVDFSFTLYPLTKPMSASELSACFRSLSDHAR